ncbi:MAG: hypothetical protein MET45_11040 [Nostoc sp. LLA-1]|nr:hypothetical protein [Cyanocohniella sp. LLY]
MSQQQKMHNSQLTTELGRKTEKFLRTIWEPLDLFGKSLMGNYWRTVYLSIQDAIAIYILLKIPDFIGHLIYGKSFSNFGICLQENALGASHYACFIIVISDFLLWIIIAARIIGRFLADLWDLRKGGRHGSDQP